MNRQSKPIEEPIKLFRILDVKAGVEHDAASMPEYVDPLEWYGEPEASSELALAQASAVADAVEATRCGAAPPGETVAAHEFYCRLLAQVPDTATARGIVGNSRRGSGAEFDTIQQTDQ